MAKIADASTLGYFKDTIWNEGIDLIIMCVFINSELAMYRNGLYDNKSTKEGEGNGAIQGQSFPIL